MSVHRQIAERDFFARWLAHLSAADDLTLAFPLLGDFPNRATAKAYGVLMEDRGIASRTTFVIDKEGKIIEIVADPKPAAHNEATAAVCARLKKK